MKKTPKKYVGSSPMKFIDPMTAQVIIGAASAFFGAKKAGRAARRAKADRDRNMGLFNEQLDIYKNEVYKNPYENMESFTEDMRVDTTAADYTAAQQRQQSADIMQGIGQNVGGAGAAALAASMSRQGALQAQTAGAGIQAQEARIKNMQLQEKRQMQQQMILGEQQVLGLERARTQNIGNMYGNMASGDTQRMNAANAQKDAANQQLFSTAANAFAPGGAFNSGGTAVPSGPTDQYVVPTPTDANNGTPININTNNGGYNWNNSQDIQGYNPYTG